MGKGKSDFKDDRDKALLNAYREAYGSIRYADCGGDMFGAAVRKALQSQQRRHWMSFWGVYRVVSRLVSGKGPRNSGSKAEAEIVEQFNRLKVKRRFKDMNIYDISNWIIGQPATGFFVSETYARRVVSSMLNKRRKG